MLAGLRYATFLSLAMRRQSRNLINISCPCLNTAKHFLIKMQKSFLYFKISKRNKNNLTIFQKLLLANTIISFAPKSVAMHISIRILNKKLKLFSVFQPWLQPVMTVFN